MTTTQNPVTETRQRICPLCEATCGLDVRIDPVAGVPLEVRGDPENVFSRGYICPKAVGLLHIERDPDRLRTPLLRNRAGELVDASWEAAWSFVGERLPAVIDAHGRDAVAIYLGNPNVHNLAGLLYAPVLARALGTRNVVSASTVDQRPKELSSALMYGTPISIPIPDVDHTMLFVVIGANPLESNGSLMTAPDMRGRLRRLRERGGRLIVIDPRRTRTAEAADLHLAIRPGSDAFLLAAVAATILEEGLARPGRLEPMCAGLDALPAALAPFTAEAVAPRCGIDAARIRELAREIAAGQPAAVYGRLGTTAQRFGTLASWLVDVVAVLTGNLDREGGSRFPLAAAGSKNATGPGGRGRGVRLGRFSSRVRGFPERFGELPAACLAEEMETPGERQVRALITVAGNPVLSTPDGARLRRAIGGLDLRIAVDVYRNETTGLADVVLPGPAALHRSHYDLAFSQLAIRNVAVYSPAVLGDEAGLPPEWETLLRLAAIAQGQGPDADIAALDDLVAQSVADREGGAASGALMASAESEGLRGPERVLDILLRTGPYGEHGRAPWADPDAPDEPAGLTLATLRRHPHGIDLGPLGERLPEVLRTPSGKVEVAPEPLIEDIARMRTALVEEADGLVLIGRRDLRSNNSWMHNIEVLARGERRCTLQLHPADAERLGVVDGSQVAVRSRVGAVEIEAEVTDAVMPGVVSIPHGWGHDSPDAALGVAARHPGVNVNLLVDPDDLDPLSGTAVLNGVPVTVLPVSASVPV